MRILITGASGSGTTTLGRAVAGAIDAAFLDADDLYWLPTDPPFRQQRDRTERRTLLRKRLAETNRIVIAGSIMGWDADVEDSLSLIVFMYAPAEIRVDRLRRRELERFGRIDEDFLAWAAQYDTGVMKGRSLPRHLAWLEQRRCPILRLSGSDPVETLLASVRERLQTGAAAPPRFTIRRAVASDAAAACDVVRRSITELCVQDHKDDAATIDAWLASKTEADFTRLLGSGEHVALVAEEAGRVLGFGLLTRGGLIALLYVSPDARFQGVSKALLAAMEDAARSLGVRTLTLDRTGTAQWFYERAGYVAAGDPKKGFGISTCYPMSKQLAP